MQDPGSIPEAALPADITANGKPVASPSSRHLDEAISLLEGTRFCWLRHSPALEEYFESSAALQRSRRFLLEGSICVLIFNLFLISDYVFFPQQFTHFLVVRLGLATPPALLALFLLFRGPSKTVRESMVVTICAIFSLSILYLYFDISPVVSSYAVTDLSILVLFTNVGFRVRFPYALCASGICLVFGSVYLLMDSTLNAPEKFESIAVLLAAILLSIVGNYSIERGDRLNFLRRMQSDVNFGALANVNDQLLTLSREDKLTGLANRGHFDETYSRLWNSTSATGGVLSVIMIDIDNFKALNDSYGHLYGDAVLQRVAMLLKQSLRREEDFAARYGGEEFIVVLPDTPQDIALRVAERIRLLIEVAGSPAVPQAAAKDHGWGTVSCGLATAVPRKGSSRKALIARADLALYQAKAEGRNRVCVADASVERRTLK
jgi:diguanylate cyclase (GGDEF)-like protein